jgi:parallel beta-helix repeat protein
MAYKKVEDIGFKKMVKESLLNYALQHAKNHPSQVVKSIHSYLMLPIQNLLSTYEEGDEYLSTKLTLKQINNAETILIKDTDEAIELIERSDFKLIVPTLPKIQIKNCHRFELDLSQLNATFIKGSANKFQILLSDCSDFSIVGGTVENARNVCLIEHCSNFKISSLNTKNCEGYGVIIFNSSYFEIKNCSFEKNLASGIYCLGNTSYGRIIQNSFIGSVGYYNCDAGLHINHCTPQIGINDIPEKSHEAKTILEKTLKPSFLFIRNNFFADNRAQGIYCEGCVMSVIEDNVIISNNKEGICFDWGSALNVFRNNTLSSNGQRASLSNEEVKADFIEHHPLLPDGSSSCKLPAISIDNGAFNIIEGNKIYRNYGGGIKMVRTGIANIICNNMIMDNGIGVNEYFKHYHGITMLGMGSGKTEFDSNKDFLNFMPSAKNIIEENCFIGLTQHHAIYAGPKCPDNFIVENNTYLKTSHSPTSDNLEILHISSIFNR